MKKITLHTITLLSIIVIIQWCSPFTIAQSMHNYASDSKSFFENVIQDALQQETEEYLSKDILHFYEKMLKDKKQLTQEDLKECLPDLMIHLLS